jgi:hypothetical protein
MQERQVLSVISPIRPVVTNVAPPGKHQYCFFKKAASPGVPHGRLELGQVGARPAGELIWASTRLLPVQCTGGPERLGVQYVAMVTIDLTAPVQGLAPLRGG